MRAISKVICIFRGHVWVSGGKIIYFHQDHSMNVWCLRCEKSVHKRNVRG